MKQLLLWLLAVCVLLTGCGSSAAEASVNAEQETEGNIVVGFSQTGSESDWRVAMSDSMKAALCEDNGFHLLFEDAQQKQENQIRAVRTFIQQEVDYIVLSPITEAGWESVLEEAQQAGIPVIIVDRRASVDRDLYAAYIGSDFLKEAQTATDWLERQLEADGRAEDPIRILDLQGTSGSSAQLGRTDGLEAAVSSHENWTLTAQIDCDFTQAKAEEVFTDLLEAGTEFDVLYCENDNIAFGVLAALDSAGLDPKDYYIISFDATHAGLEECLAGNIDLDIECSPLDGPRVAEIIRQLEQGKTPSKSTYIPERWFETATLTQAVIDLRPY